MDWRVTADGIVQSTKISPVEEIMLGAYLERVFVENSEKIAFVDTETDQRYTFGEVLKITRSIGAVLQDRGLKPHDLVVVCATTGIQSCCYLLALIFSQATMLGLMPSVSVYEFQALMKNFRSVRLVIGDRASAPKLREASGVEVLDLEENWDLSREAKFKVPGHADPKSSVMILALTSGSTGPSKTVRLSHFASLANLVQWDSVFAKYLMCNPISHLSGMFCFLKAMANCETMFMASENLRNDLNKYLDVCSKYKAERNLAMPALFTALTKYGATDKLASVKRLFTAGSAIPKSIIDEFRALHPHIDIEILFASSEAGVVLRSADLDKPHCLAVAPNVEAKIVDLETNETLGPNQNGMLHVKAPAVALGYLNNEEATNQAFVDGWHITGDLAYRDEDGYVVIVDRVKQLIKCMDSQVVPADLELLLSQDDDVLKVLVGGVPHDKYGEAAVAFVVPRKSANLAELRRRLLDDVKSKCVFHKHLHGGLFFVATIPETDSGKFSRKEIVAMHLREQIEYLE